jgi:hypothetical protein
MLSQQAAHVNVLPAASASFCMRSTCTTYHLSSNGVAGLINFSGSFFGTLCQER